MAESSRKQQALPNEQLSETLPLANSSKARENNKSARDKVLIPRGPTRVAPPIRVRTKNACEACRKRRIKCDGNRPVCQPCEGTDTECVYSDHKRVRDRQEMKTLKSVVDKYEHLLRDLLQEVPAGAAKRIKYTLTEKQPGGSSPQMRDPSLSESSTSSAGSVQGIDTIGEDLNRSEESRTTGFMGKNSVLSWLRKIELDSGHGASPDRSMEGMNLPSSTTPHLDTSNNAVSYFLDDKQLPANKYVDSLKLPPRQLADWILGSYFKSVHHFFPIVRENLFMEQYRALWGPTSPKPGRKWLAIFNMILAIGCRQLQLLQISLPTDANDEVFFSRARILSVNENMAFEHAALQQVQVEALVALYFMVSMQINRAWKVSGIAVRSAMALAINLRITDSELHHTSKEARSRLWWSIYMLENILSHMTGRPTCIGSASFSVPQPIPFTEDMFEHPQVVELLQSDTLRRQCLSWSLDEQENEDEPVFQLKDIEPNQGLQFYYLVDLMHIVHVAIGELFSPTGFQASRSYIKRRIRFYDEKIDHWLSRLHPAFRFLDVRSNNLVQITSQEQTVLALHHYSARITLYRPCSPFHRYTSSKEKEYMYISERCLNAALSLISIFPDTVDLDWVYTLSPWWCILHFLMQASTILIMFGQGNDGSNISSSYGGSIERNIHIRNACLKAHAWLHSLSEVDESCRRAFQLYDGLAQRMGLVTTLPPAAAAKSSSSPPFGYHHEMMPTTESGQGYMQDQSGMAYTTQQSSTLHAETQPFDPGNIAAAIPMHFNESESMGGNITAANSDLMTDNYTQWIRAALEDQDTDMNFSDAM